MSSAFFRLRTKSARPVPVLTMNWNLSSLFASGVPKNFVREGGFQQIQLRTEDRENGDLGAVAL